jgi:hypothetical protein
VVLGAALSPPPTEFGDFRDDRLVVVSHEDGALTHVFGRLSADPKPA